MVISPNNINNIQNTQMHRSFKPSFKKGQFTIVASADTHGQVDTYEKLDETLKKYKKTIFPLGSAKGNKTVCLLAGDIFMNPERHNLTNPAVTDGEVQLACVNRLMDTIKTVSGDPNFKAYFCVGDHDLDAGDRYLFNLLKRANMTTVITNSDFSKSPVLSSLTTDEEKKKVQNSVVLEVPDDKNPNLVHKALLLSVANMSTEFYTPGLVKELDITDKTNKKDVDIKEEDLKQTYQLLYKTIEDFKKANPKSPVIAICHTGGKISEMIARNTHGPGVNIDIIFNGHDHKDREDIIKHDDGTTTRIISLWSNNRKVNAVQVPFDDNGNPEAITSRPIYTEKINNPGNIFHRLLDYVFSKDRRPWFRIKPRSKDPNKQNSAKELSFEDVRYNNSPLANLITDGVLTSLQKYDPKVQVFGILSANIRSGLPVNKPITNLEWKNVLIGCNNTFSGVQTADLKGYELAEMTIEWLKGNEEEKDRNPLVQLSGMQINKAGFSELYNQQKFKLTNPFIPFVEDDYQSLIKIKNEQGIYEPLDMDKTYRIAFPEELLKVPNVKFAIKLKNRFTPTNKNIDGLFREYVRDNHNEVTVDLDEKRVIAAPAK